MEILELGYKTFSFVSSRNVPSDAYVKYIWEKKEQILSLFSDIYKVEEVFNYGIKNIKFFNTVAIKDSSNKEIVLAINKEKANPALNLFEMLINIRYLSQNEINFCKNTYFHKRDNVLVFYKQINTLEGNFILNTLVNTFNFHKSNNNLEVKEKADSFRVLSEFVRKNFIICRRCVDILENIHFETIINPNIAIDENVKEDINNHLKNIDALCDF